MSTWKDSSYVRKCVDKYFFDKYGSYEGYNPFEADRVMKTLPSRIIWQSCMCADCNDIQEIYYDVANLNDRIKEHFKSL